ncbi:MAG: M3 family oligoendopeptidase [Planctomycetota bacterium]
MSVTHNPDRGTPEFPRQYVAIDDDFGLWETAEQYYRELVERKIDSREELDVWLFQASELEACLNEEGVKRHVATTLKVDDEAIRQQYVDFLEQVEASREPWRDKLLRRFVELVEKYPPPKLRIEVFERSARNSIALYRDENVPLLTEDKKLINEYDQITGAMTCEYDGREQTLQQMARYLEEPDRQVRETTWRMTAERFHEDTRRLNELYEKMVALRHRIAVNADCSDYRAYMFKALERFDYTPDDCLEFHDTIEQVVVPAARELHARRQKQLGLDTLRPWDFSVDPQGRPPLRPFETEAQLVDGCGQIFHRVDPELGRVFDTLRQRGLLDLSSRKGKAPGGYQTTFTERRVPFIFMNAVGTDTDVRTLLHEGGHAFHSWACRGEPLLAYRECENIIEFAEVASMGMECLALPHTEVLFGDESERATRQFFERIVGFFPFMARIDAFQHHVYTHVDAGLADWVDYWQSLTRRFSPEIDYSGLEQYDQYSWQRKLHIYAVPFYYVEYGIAQLGALQIWLNSRRNYNEAVAFYRNGLALGGARPLPELFEAAGCRFDFSEKTLRPLIEAVMEEIARH